MSLVERILEAVRDLDEPQQRRVLDVATRLGAEPDVSLTGVPLGDSAAVHAWTERVRVGAALRLEDELARLRGLGLVDEDGQPTLRELPDDMKHGSKTSVAV